MECIKLLESVSIRSTRHIAAISRHTAAVGKNDTDEAEISELEGAMRLRAVERQEAVDVYWNHLMIHAAELSAARSAEAVAVHGSL
jgi:hypothetical protein